MSQVINKLNGGDRRPFIAGNWKMFKDCQDAAKAAREIVQNVKDNDYADIMIAPAFTALQAVFTQINKTNVSMGAQNIFYEDQGAYTGEISGKMLISTGCKYVIVGHSERRTIFNETDNAVSLKLEAAVRAGLIPILCIGESENERETGKTFYVLDKQIKNSLKRHFFDGGKELIIAYEPIWAIGTGKSASSAQAQEAHKNIRLTIDREFGDKIAKSIRILYGGSVKPDNIAELMEMPDIDGALVGGASLDPFVFGKIVNFKNKNT